MDVTRYATGDGRGESRDPYRPDPNLTGPTAYEWSPTHHGVQLGDAVAASDGMMR